MSTATTTKPSALASIQRYELHNGRLQGSPYGGIVGVSDVQPIIEALERERDELRAKLEVSEAALQAAVSKAQWQAVSNRELNELQAEVQRLKDAAAKGQ